MKIDKSSYEKLINGDIDWLMKNTERDLERDHIVSVLKDSIDRIYKEDECKKKLIRRVKYWFKNIGPFVFPEDEDTLDELVEYLKK